MVRRWSCLGVLALILLSSSSKNALEPNVSVGWVVQLYVIRVQELCFCWCCLVLTFKIFIYNFSATADAAAAYFNLTRHLPRRLIGRGIDLVLWRSRIYWFPRSVLVRVSVNNFLKFLFLIYFCFKFYLLFGEMSSAAASVGRIFFIVPRASKA